MKKGSTRSQSKKNPLSFAFAILFPSFMDRLSIWAIHILLSELNGLLIWTYSISVKVFFFNRKKKNASHSNHPPSSKSNRLTE